MHRTVPGVNVFVSKGTIYAYDRKTRRRLTPPLTLYSPEWFAALHEIRSRPNTARAWRELVRAYRASPRYVMDIAPRTRADYDGVFRWLEPCKAVPLDPKVRP
jgi:hypothetical protein